MTRKTPFVALFLLVACLIPRIGFASMVTLTMELSGGSPYDFSISGSSTLADLSRLNGNRTVYPTYASWAATDVNLQTLTSTDSKSTNVGGISVGQLEEDAYLDSKYGSNDPSIRNIGVQDAIWSILDGTLGHYGTYVYTGLNGPEDETVQNYVAAAASFAAITSGTSSFSSDFTFHYPQTWGTRDRQLGDIPQQFFGHSAR